MNKTITAVAVGVVSMLALGGPASATPVPSAQSIVFASSRDGNFNIYAANRDGDNPRRLTNDPANEFSPAASPNQKQIAYVAQEPDALRRTLMLLDLDTNQTKPLLDDEATDYMDPTWSPDGKQLAFTSTSTEGDYESCLHIFTLSTLTDKEILCGDTLLALPD